MKNSKKALLEQTTLIPDQIGKDETIYSGTAYSITARKRK